MNCLMLLLIVCGLQLATGPLAHGVTPNDKLVRLQLDKKITINKGSSNRPVTSYFVKVDVGTPAKTFEMLIDLNAREIWLPHYSSMGLVLGRLNYNRGYSKKDSSTSVKEEKEVYKIAYKKTELSGKAYTDKFQFINVHPDKPEKLVLDQRFLAISSASNDNFMMYGVDGVLPLNPWPISETGSYILPMGLARIPVIKEQRFGLELDTNESSTRGGELTIGGFNPTKFLGPLRFHNMAAQHAWEIHLHDVMLGGKSIIGSGTKSTALISTNTNDIHGPDEYIKKIVQSMGTAVTYQQDDSTSGIYKIDCLKVSALPSISFVIDDVFYGMHPASFVSKRVEGMFFKTESCYLRLFSNGSTNKWELGTSFLANYYSVFDLNKRQIAFGAKL